MEVGIGEMQPQVKDQHHEQLPEAGRETEKFFSLECLKGIQPAATLISDFWALEL